MIFVLVVALVALLIVVPWWEIRRRRPSVILWPDLSDFEKQMVLLRHQINEVGIQIGAALVPALQRFGEAAAQAGQAFAKLADADRDGSAAG